MKILKSFPIKNSTENLNINSVVILDNESGVFLLFDTKYQIKFNEKIIDVNFNEIKEIKKIDYRIVISRVEQQDLSIDFDEWDDANQFIEIHKILSKGAITDYLLEMEKVEEFHSTLASKSPTTYVTYGLIFINVCMYIATAIYGGNWFEFDTKTLNSLGANFGPHTINGQYWRYFTSIFLHGSLVHMAINMQSLWYLGTQVERLYGTKHFLVLYVLCGLLGSAFSNLIDPTVVSVGASGAIFGIAAAYLVLLVKPSINIPKSLSSDLLYSAGFFLVYNLFYGFTKSGIDNGAHLGGAIGGLVFGYIMSRPIANESKENEAKHLFTTSIFSTFLFLTSSYLIISQAPKLHEKKYSKALENYYISKGYDAYGSARYNEAFKYFEEAASTNNASAQYFLALLHIEQTKDMKSAFKWALAAAGNNSQEAMPFVGEMYFRGDGTQKDYKKAYEYFLKSKELAVSEYYLGVMHTNGFYVKKDPIDGMKWFAQSADKNNASGQSSLAYGYMQGVGVKQSYDEAIKYFRLAAKNNDAYAQLNLGAMYIDGIGIKKDTSKGLMWAYLSTKQGDPEFIDAFKKISAGATKTDVDVSIKNAEYCFANKFEKCD